MEKLIGKDLKSSILGNTMIINTRHSCVAIGKNEPPSNPAVSLELTSNDQCLLLNKLTTGKRDNIQGVNGMLIYNKTTKKFQGYSQGSWVDLH